MDVEYNAREASISSRIHASLEPKSNRGSDFHSPEDIAWADSCLINHPEHLNGDWNSVRYALLEILDNEPCSVVSASDRDDMDVVPSFGQTNGKEFIDDRVVASRCEEAGTMDYRFVAEDEGDVFLSEILDGNIAETYLQESIWPIQNNAIEARFQKNAFLINEDEASIGSSMTKEIEVSTKDLKTPTEEEERDEFVKRLKKALASLSVHLSPSTSSDSVALRAASVDDLIAKTQYLSMNRTYG